MKHLLFGLGAILLLGVAVAFSGIREGGSNPTLRFDQQERNPWSSTDLNNAVESFQFAIVSDRTGGHRAKIFSQTVARLNYLQPEFVISVGDLIEGGSGKSDKQLAKEWQEFDGFIKKLEMPFFYIPGNHDTGARNSDAFWRKKLGRRNYHFVYKNVLFLCLNTDDPPGSGRGHIGKEQLQEIQAVLAANPARWTLVFLHKPIWLSSNLKNSGWLDVEKALGDRPYTVFCGHLHRYKKYFRNGRAYYQLATTGGVSRVRGTSYGEFDHIVWVTMKKEGPVLANILVDAILPDDLKTPESSEPGLARTRKPTQPVHGWVYYKGSPVPDAYVVFQSVPRKGERGIRADGVAGGDGSFTLSTYKAFDGAPEGDYQVTVVQRRPFYTIEGNPGPNLLPARYESTRTSGLTAHVTRGKNDIVFSLND
jgi:3',5'-cyclic AMP phosphodiesterase CpdA